MHDIGHRITGGEHDRAGLYFTPIGQGHPNRTPGGIKRHGFGVKQACASRHRDIEKPARQLHRIGIGRAL